ncbi:hypothetical protein ACROYT_G013435 [Oculina patagonica]
MATASPKEVNRYLSCPICMEQFKEPKVLACLHTYCKACLVKLVKKKGPDHVITCPECRQDVKIVNGDVGKLQPNFWVNNFMTLLSMQDSTSSAGKPLICEHCDSGDPAVSRCTECCVFMCKFCVTAHKRINTTKGHQIMSLDEVKQLGSKALVKPAFCKKHSGETLKLFCQTCQKTICRDCTIVDHREHKYDFVADVAEKEKKVVQAVLLESKEKESVIEEGLIAVQTMEQRVQAKIVEVSKEVDVFFDEQVKALEYLRGNLKHEVTTQGQIKLKQLGSQKEMLSLSLAQLKSGVDFAERALADGDDVELLSVKTHLVERLAQLNTSQVQSRPCKTDYLKLKVDKTIWDIGEMATVHHTPIDPTKCVLSMIGGEEGVMYETLAGQPVDFVLVIKDENAAENLLVHALVNHGSEDQQELAVKYNQDSKSYVFSYCPKKDGVCTLAVMVEVENICGSPFTWKVKPKVQNTDQLNVLTSSQEQGGDCKGKHCWKLKVHLLNAQDKNFEVGVQCVKQEEFFGVEVQRCCLCCRYRFDGRRGRSKSLQFSRSDNPHAAINSLCHDDVFSVYLNFDTKKLVIYNTRSKQAEVFTDVNVGNRVVPIILPYIKNPDGQQAGFSLDFE